jgi:hypothetical protein
MPWSRCYTLNIDDIEAATAGVYRLPRQIEILSATSETTAMVGGGEQQLVQYVHLNGTIADIPQNVTFSVTQYAERLARPEPWYVRLNGELLSHSCVFIGTQLDETPFWQHLQLRKMRGGREMAELRPRSYLVIPSLDLPRQALLAEYNILWLPMTAEEFAANVLSQLQDSARKGIHHLGERSAATVAVTRSISEVSKLAVNPHELSHFLLGQEPIWADLQSGRAISRSCDSAFADVVQQSLRSPTPGLIVLTGTAGSGKSTSLMRLSLKLTAEGIHVGFINRETDLSPRDIRVEMRKQGAPQVLAIDDADIFGSDLASLVKELALASGTPLIMLGVRSGKVDRVLPPAIIADVPSKELVMPPLGDEDIDALLEILDRENRLGLLKGLLRHEQRAAFREVAGRQLLVAMIKATSGKWLEEKCIDELTGLGTESARIYAMIAVASSFGFGLQRDEAMISLNDYRNTVLNDLDQLLRRHIVIERSDRAVWARHRVIAEVIREEIQRTGQLRPVVNGLALVAATKVTARMSRSERPDRILRSVINHEFLKRSIGYDGAQNLYGSLETLLNWDFQFWLQRGALEVEIGELTLAEQFLNQARSLNSDDPFVLNEWAYLLFCKALKNPKGAAAPKLIDEATELLDGLINRYRNSNPYPYHVIASQGLSWARHGITDPSEKQLYLSRLLKYAREGSRLHPRDNHLKTILAEVEHEYLSGAVAINPY